MSELFALEARTAAIDLDAKAQRIRDLVGMARGCIIEIGRELTAVSGSIPHRTWLEWLDREFNWSDKTAHRYIQVASAFLSDTVSDSDEILTIEASALYVLAAPDVPPEVRAAAVSKAKSGAVITKAEADRITAKAIQKAVATAIEAERAVAEEDLNTARRQIRDLSEQLEDQDSRARDASTTTMQMATDTLHELQQAYDAMVARHDALAAQLDYPDDALVVRIINRLAGRKPSRTQLVALASALGRSIDHGGKTYAPVSGEELSKLHAQTVAAAHNLEHLFEPGGAPDRWHTALEALRQINRLDSVASLFAQRYRSYDHVFAVELPAAAAWMAEFHQRMRDEPAGEQPASAAQPRRDRQPDQKPTQATRPRRLQHQRGG